MQISFVCPEQLFGEHEREFLPNNKHLTVFELAAITRICLSFLFRVCLRNVTRDKKNFGYN